MVNNWLMVNYWTPLLIRINLFQLWYFPVPSTRSGIPPGRCKDAASLLRCGCNAPFVAISSACGSGGGKQRRRPALKIAAGLKETHGKLTIGKILGKIWEYDRFLVGMSWDFDHQTYGYGSVKININYHYFIANFPNKCLEERNIIGRDVAWSFDEPATCHIQVVVMSPKQWCVDSFHQSSRGLYNSSPLGLTAQWLQHVIAMTITDKLHPRVGESHQTITMISR